MIELASEAARLTILPEAGASFGTLTVGGRSVLRSAPFRANGSGPPSCHIILLPFSNRIGGGKFCVDGVEYSLPGNVEGEKLPLHGDAFQRPWRVVEHTPDFAALELADGAIGPFRYRARLAVSLAASGLHLALGLTSHSASALPFGCGFHPWFPRSAATRLRFAARSVWLNDDQHLSKRCVPVASLPSWDFSRSRAFPKALINNSFIDWDGTAAIDQSPGYVSLRMSSSTRLSTAILYSPGAGADFFCLEPVSHPIDAHHLPGRPGLAMLAPGDSLQSWMRLDWSAEIGTRRS